jgi:hypothetical protein
MGRIRSVRPDFFADDDVCALPVVTRYLLLGLATLADDQGVFRMKPKAIKRAILPDDDVQIEELIQQLVQADLIRSFEAEGSTFGAIRGWGRHQKPRDPRAHYPLPHDLDQFTRIIEVTPPTPRKDRGQPPWPMRPVQHFDSSEHRPRPDKPGVDGGRVLIVSTDVGRRAHDVGTTSSEPVDVIKPSTREGRGLERREGEGAAAGGRMPEPLPSRPPELAWMPLPRWEADIRLLLDHARSKTRLRRLGDESLIKGIIAGLTLAVGDRPEDEELPVEERAQRRRLRRDPAFNSSTESVIAWMDDLVERASGKTARYLRAAFVGGPTMFEDRAHE